MNRSTRTISLLKTYGMSPSASILDAGCGMGETLQALKEAGYANLSGIDPDPAHVAHIQVMIGIPVSIAGVLSAQIEHNQFDAILFLDVLEHVESGTEQAVIDALFSFLKPGGILVLSVPYAGVAALVDPANIKKIVTLSWSSPWHRHYTRKRILRYVRPRTVLTIERRGIGLSQAARLLSFPLRRLFNSHGKIMRLLARIGERDYMLQAGCFSYHLLGVIQRPKE